MTILDSLGSYSLSLRMKLLNFLKIFVKEFKTKKGFVIWKIRSDYGGKFENEFFKKFCDENGSEHIFSFTRTP